jgi:hypothetical protein
MRSTKKFTGGSMGLVLSAAMIAALAGGSLAGEPETNDGGQKVHLGGPKVENGGKPERGEHTREHPRLMEYMAAIRSLRQSKDESLAISAEQRASIGEAVRAHRAAMAAFIEEHKDEIAELRVQAGMPAREEAGERRQGGQRGANRPQRENEMGQPGEDGMEGEPKDDGTQRNEGRPARAQAPTPEQQEARDRLRELMEQGPDEGAVVRSIEAALSGEQVKAVRDAIESNRERRRGEGVQERRQRGPEQTDRVRGQRPAARGEKKKDASDD